MSASPRRPGGSLEERVERTLSRCSVLSRRGRHRKVLAEIERLADAVDEQPRFEAHLLLWKAQALLALGRAEQALEAASRSWEEEATPHACHLMASAHSFLGKADRAEATLRVGTELFPGVPLLAVELATMLAEQGRIPETLEVLEALAPSEPMPEELYVYMVGLHADALAAAGRWDEANAVLAEGLRRHPEANALRGARRALKESQQRRRAEHRLATSWAAGLRPLEGVGHEVDEEITYVGQAAELPKLYTLAARRLWRSFLASEAVRPQVPRAWAAGVLGAVLDLDGLGLPATLLARHANAAVATVRTARRRVLGYVESLEPAFALRSFAVRENPRLGERRERGARTRGSAVVHFPSEQAKGEGQ
ncbi:MAG: hypothetical protein LJE95_01070 [Acidobacteria bacterium]|nr:hypothetical protein [Acidobacteriota bacterium]